jgi:hypothetical protein
MRRLGEPQGNGTLDKNQLRLKREKRYNYE